MANAHVKNVAGEDSQTRIAKYCSIIVGDLMAGI